METIFISYRREDSEGQAGRLHDFLANEFGRERVFMDVTGIDAGADFTEEIDRRIDRCKVLLVVIGRRWLDARDAEGRRRLDLDGDFVRLETSRALASAGKTVIPVLIGGATMPGEKDLPENLRKLAKMNATILSHQNWDSDLIKLRQRLDRLIGSRLGWVKWAVGAVLGLGALGSGGWYASEHWFGQKERDEKLALAAQQEKERIANELEKTRLERELLEERNRVAQLLEDKKRREAELAKEQEQAAAAAAEKARQEAAAKADAEQRRIAQEEADRLAAEQARAKREADEKAREAEKVRVAAEAASAAAAQNAAKDRDLSNRLQLATRVARDASVKAVNAGSRAVLAPTAEISGGRDIAYPLSTTCGSAVTINGTGRFKVEPAPGGGMLVSVGYRGSGGGYTVRMGGQKVFPQPQTTYEITADGEWTGPRDGKPTWTVRVNASGTQVTGVNGVRFSAGC